MSRTGLDGWARVRAWSPARVWAIRLISIPAVWGVGVGLLFPDVASGTSVDQAWEAWVVLGLITFEAVVFFAILRPGASEVTGLRKGIAWYVLLALVVPPMIASSSMMLSSTYGGSVLLRHWDFVRVWLAPVWLLSLTRVAPEGDR